MILAAGTRPLPSIPAQIDRLIALDVHRFSGIRATTLRALAVGLEGEDGLLVLHPERAPASALAPLIERDGKSGFVVVDMADIDHFRPIDRARPPDGMAYLVKDLDRGDDLADWSPNEAMPEILRRGRTPLTLTEGLHWVLQQPDVLERGRCFMTIGSRLRKPNGTVDARTPALWISNGTGRDGRHRRNAPKAGWCWAGNRHTWLGFGSAAGREPLPGVT